MSALDEWFAGLPQGAFWCTGDMLRELGLRLREDRAVLAPGLGNEIPTSSGRVFYLGAGHASAAVEKYAFQGYRSTFTGDPEDLPANQSFRVRVATGTVNDRIPSNNHAEFVCDAGKTYFWIAGTFEAETCQLTAAVIAKGAVPPEDPDPPEGAGPTQGSRVLFEVICDGVGVKEINPIWKGPLEVHGVVRRFDCESNTMVLQWGRAAE